MKKLAMIICIVSVILFGMLPVSADNTASGEETAAVNRVYYQCDTAETVGGEFLEYKISIKDADHLGRIQCAVLFDMEKLEWISGEFSQIIKTDSNNMTSIQDKSTEADGGKIGISVNLKIATDDSPAIALDGDFDIVTLRFKVKDEAVGKKVDLNFGKIKIAKANTENGLVYLMASELCSEPVIIRENYALNNFSAENGTASGLINAKTAQKTAKMLVCAYNENRLVSVDAVDLSDVSGEKDFNMNYDKKADKIKIMFLDGYSGLKPFEPIRKIQL